MGMGDIMQYKHCTHNFTVWSRIRGVSESSIGKYFLFAVSAYSEASPYGLLICSGKSSLSRFRQPDLELLYVAENIRCNYRIADTVTRKRSFSSKKAF